jgi:hypothetical protein
MFNVLSSHAAPGDVIFALIAPKQTQVNHINEAPTRSLYRWPLKLQESEGIFQRRENHEWAKHHIAFNVKIQNNSRKNLTLFQFG